MGIPMGIPIPTAALLKVALIRCHILRLNICIQIDFLSAPGPVGGVYTAPTDPLAGFSGYYF